MTNFAVAIRGVETVQEFRDMGRNIGLSLVQAINRTADDSRTVAARNIQGQINLPRSYLQKGSGRLEVTRRATRSTLEATITARARPTSLAQFATSRVVNRAGVRVRVQPGQAAYLRRAFLIRLPGRGGQTTETFGNLALAVRLRPGERLDNKIKQVQVGKSLQLLYGPSVQQVFLDNSGKGVADDMAPEILRDLETEFLRLVRL